MTPLAVDHERPRLGRKVPFLRPLVEAAVGVVVLEDLDVDEADVGSGKLLTHAVDDVHGGAADPARAELRRREGDDERRAVLERLLDRVLQELDVGRRRGRDVLREPVLDGRVVRGDGVLAHRRDGRLGCHLDLADPLDVGALRLDEDRVLARVGEVEIGDVHGGRVEVACLRRHADRNELRGGLAVRHGRQAAGRHPNASRLGLDERACGVHEEERQAVLPDRVVGGAEDQGAVLRRVFLEQGLDGAVRGGPSGLACGTGLRLGGRLGRG